jgi:hypothetical protein
MPITVNPPLVTLGITRKRLSINDVRTMDIQQFGAQSAVQERLGVSLPKIVAITAILFRAHGGHSSRRMRWLSATISPTNRITLYPVSTDSHLTLIDWIAGVE